MTDVFVLDSSAVLAVILAETGAETVAPVVRKSKVSAVNHAEAVGKLLDKSWTPEDAAFRLDDLGYEIVAFDATQGLEAGLLRSRTRRHGLSLGDRACITLAAKLGLPVMTADRAWGRLDLPVEIRLIR